MAKDLNRRAPREGIWIGGAFDNYRHGSGVPLEPTKGLVLDEERGLAGSQRIDQRATIGALRLPRAEGRQSSHCQADEVQVLWPQHLRADPEHKAGGDDTGLARPAGDEGTHLVTPAQRNDIEDGLVCSDDQPSDEGHLDKAEPDQHCERARQDQRSEPNQTGHGEAQQNAHDAEPGEQPIPEKDGRQEGDSGERRLEDTEKAGQRIRPRELGGCLR